VLLVASQVGALGTIIEASSESAAGAEALTFNTNVLAGKRDEPMLQLCARRIIETAAEQGFRKSMVICLGLSDHSMQTMREVAAAVAENNVWSS
jgi:proteasome assembly chaperone 3